MFALLAVLMPGIGVTINGAHRWIQLGPLTVQPSEFAKFAILLWGADLLARKETLKTLTTRPARAGAAGARLRGDDRAGDGSSRTSAPRCASCCCCSACCGWSACRCATSPACWCWSPARSPCWRVTESYRLQRLTTFLHPNLDPQGAGYHTMQGLYALSSGGIFGVGLGQGTSKYGWVPNANTDYVFAVVGEELGLLGCVVVLVLFALFTYAAMRIALRSQDPFVRLVASGAAIWIAGQALINVGYVTALLPVTGIPLPFISNGGTSLMLTCAVLGMLVSFARHEPAAVAGRAAVGRRPAAPPRWVRLLRLGAPQLDRDRRTPSGQAGRASRPPGRPPTRPAAKPRGRGAGDPPARPDGCAKRRHRSDRARQPASRAATGAGQPAAARAAPDRRPGAGPPQGAPEVAEPERRSRSAS